LNATDAKQNFNKLEGSINSNPQWEVHQLSQPEDGAKPHYKQLFPGIPSPLVIDFFKNNMITSCKNLEGELYIKAIGLDEVEWQYKLISSSKTEL
jgi:hypothetical protein